MTLATLHPMNPTVIAGLDRLADTHNWLTRDSDGYSTAERTFRATALARGYTAEQVACYLSDND